MYKFNIIVLMPAFNANEKGIVNLLVTIGANKHQTDILYIILFYITLTRIGVNQINFLCIF